jgi:flagellar biosynthetic protein FliR
MEIMEFLLNNSSTFLFVFIRTSSILLLAPIFGAVNVPMQVKMGLSFLIALVLTPLTPFAGIAGEMLLGASMGLVVRFVFTGVEFAGQIASFQMGLGMANAYDPIHSAQVTVMGRLLSIFTLLVFLSVNGHLMVISALKKSFDAIPPYGFSLSGGVMEDIVLFSKEMFVLAVKLSAPVIAILTFTNIALGIMARTVPQLNMFVVGFGVTIAAGFIMIMLSLPVLESSLMVIFDDMWEGVFQMMGAIGRG